MTDLSPAAQAVLDAAVVVSWDWSNLEPASSSVVASATLRAASSRMMDLIGDICHPKYLEGVEASSDLLDQIATELENHQ
jgi:hypothetical protein